MSGEKSKERNAGRKLAEWVTLGISALIILFLAGYLLLQVFRGNEPMVPVEVKLGLDETQQVAGRFVLPVHIMNNGQQTLRDLKLELTYQPPEATEPESTDLQVDYLGELSAQTVYFYFEHPPGELKIEARPASYRLD